MSTEENKVYVRAIVGIALLSTLLLLLPAPVAAQAKSQTHTWHAVVGVDNSNHAIQGMAFLPHELWINVGDTVAWTAKSGDVHTVTFLKPGQTLPPFDPTDPLQVLPQGGSVYDGVSYYNSGLLGTLAIPGLPILQTYTLTFGVNGDFIYYCLLHPSMIGVVHVRPAGTHYPFSQADYNKQIEQQTKTIMDDGAIQADQARNSSTNHNVTLGIGDGLVALMRFYPQHIVIHVGDTVTFTNRDAMEPHTVTFGTLPPNFNDFFPLGNPQAFDGSAPLNSGFLVVGGPFGTTYQVTFVKAGTYAFRCDLHDFLGMLATIVVKS